MILSQHPATAASPRASPEPRIPPSTRGIRPQFLCEPPSVHSASPVPVGVDTVRLSGPISGTDWATSMADSITETHTVDCVTGEVERWAMWVPGDLPFRIEVSGAEATLVVECSLPRRRTGTNLRPLTADEARQEVAHLYEYFDETPPGSARCPTSGSAVWMSPSTSPA